MILSFLLLWKPIHVLHCEPHLLGMWNVLAGHGANVIVEWLGEKKAASLAYCVYLNRFAQKCFPHFQSMVQQIYITVNSGSQGHY